MTTAVQHRRGTTAEHSTFTGLEGEVTIDTTKDTAVIHDGVLAGGYPLAKENLANVTTSGLASIDGASTASDDKFFIYDQSATTLKTITRAELNNAIEQDALANVAITGGTINGTAIGGTTAAAGAFSTLSASGAVTLSGGTANSIPYLNGSKVLTTGSALTFDGTNLGVGIGTRNALYKIKNGIKAELAGGNGEKDNGNGSLMRILPLVFAIKDLHIEERFERTRRVSSITHGHIRAVMACFYYLEFAKQLIEGKSKFEIYNNLQLSIPTFFEKMGISGSEIAHFDRLLKANIADLPLSEIRSGGYVIETIEASIWCLLTTDNYKDAVLKAVNLGHDTDTTAAVTGGLAGLLYGFDAIPKEWIEKLARMEEIEQLSLNLSNALII